MGSQISRLAVTVWLGAASFSAAETTKPEELALEATGAVSSPAQGASTKEAALPAVANPGVTDGTPLATLPAEPLASPANAPSTGLPGKEVPWAGSTLTYGHDFSTLSLKKDAEPDYNPVYSHRLEISPRWSLSPRFGVRASFELSQELTTADDTLKRRELVVSDLPLTFDWNGFEEPRSKIKLSSSVRFILPLSKIAHAQSRRLTIGPGVALSRAFAVLGGLTLGYDGRYNERLHKYTTTQYDTPAISACGNPETSGCLEFSHSGMRNVRRDVSHGPNVALQVLSKLALTSQFSFSHRWLYPLTEVSGDVANAPGFETDAGVSSRHFWTFALGADWNALPALTVSPSLSTLSMQLRPDGTRRSPFFNRNTMFGLSVSLNLDAVLPKP